MILFLDFDGVLHQVSRPHGVLSLLPRLERVLREFPEVEIVISSAWRQHYGLDALRSFFSEDIAARIVGATPELGDPVDFGYSREAEILAWLREQGRQDEAWLAIDDMPDFFSAGCSRLLAVDPDCGFDAAAECALRRRLGRAQGQ